MKTRSMLTILALGAAFTLTACEGVGFVPASQAPRPYTAAHDIINGECRNVSLRSTTASDVDPYVSSGKRVVRCPQEAGGVEDAGGVQVAR